MSVQRFTADEPGQRLDAFLARRLAGYARAHVKDLVERGFVLVDGKRREADHRLRGGEVVEVSRPGAGWGDPSDFEDWVLHEDADLLVLRKPAGLIMHPMGESWLARPEAALDEPEANLAGLLLKFRPAAARSGVERCGLVHRLDRQTSGVLVVAKRPSAQQALLSAFRERRARKVYRAIVLGEVKPTKVEAPIGRLPGTRKVRVTPWGRESSTGFAPVAVARGMSLVQAEPLTGRTHQIRAHLALLKHPVAGDIEWFGASELAKLKALGHEPPPRLMLHAWRLVLPHPNGKQAAYMAPLPKDFKDYWKAVGGKAA